MHSLFDCQVLVIASTCGTYDDDDDESFFISLNIAVVWLFDGFCWLINGVVVLLLEMNCCLDDDDVLFKLSSINCC